MSGITGWIAYERDLTAERKTLAGMNASLSRRGPDGAGLWIQPHAGLGYARLDIPRGGTGEQPFVIIASAGAPVAIVYDGQVYNAKDIGRELRDLGHSFRTDSDAEVVLRGYLEWGEDVVDRLIGMYAFAIWDGRSERLFMVRDRLGLRPLYFYPLPDGLLFGSEPKAILAHPLADRVVDAEGMCEIYSGFMRTPGSAIWSGMSDLKPGSVVTVDRRGWRERKYWHLTAETHDDDQEATIRTARELLSECVRQQMPDSRSDPCCVLLSGGLDSSALTGLAVLHAREQGRTVRTFTLDFVEQDKYYKPELDPARPDPPFAHDVVKHLGTEHTDLVLHDAVLADPAIRQACVEARDLPVGFGDRDMSLYLMCTAVRDHARVAFSGDGAQVFGPSPGGGRAEREPSREGPRRVPLSDDALVDASFLARIGRDDYSRQRTAEAMAEIPALDGESETDRRIRVHYHLSLSRVASWATSERRDRIAAAAGAEIRTPYYDHRLAQYLFNTPWRLKSFDGMDRSLLRAVAGETVPVSVKERKKKGYPGILHFSYSAALQRQVQDLINSNHSALEFYDRQQLAAAVSEAPGSVSRAQKFGMERLLDLAIWMDSRRPVFRLP